MDKTVGTLSPKVGFMLLRVLELKGFSDQHAQRVLRYPELAKKIVEMLNREEFPVLSQRARQIMDTDFYGVEESVRHLGAAFSKRERTEFAAIPICASELHALKGTHVIAAVAEMSLAELYEKNRKLFCDGDWFLKKEFAHNKGKAGWIALRKTPVEGSLGQPFADQTQFVDKNFVVADVRRVAQLWIEHVRATGEYLFNDISCRCSDVDYEENHVRVSSSKGLLRISNCHDSSREPDLGIAALSELSL